MHGSLFDEFLALQRVRLANNEMTNNSIRIRNENTSENSGRVTSLGMASRRNETRNERKNESKSESINPFDDWDLYFRVPGDPFPPHNERKENKENKEEKQNRVSEAPQLRSIYPQPQARQRDNSSIFVRPRTSLTRHRPQYHPPPLRFSDILSFPDHLSTSMSSSGRWNMNIGDDNIDIDERTLLNVIKDDLNKFERGLKDIEKEMCNSNSNSNSNNNNNNNNTNNCNKEKLIQLCDQVKSVDIEEIRNNVSKKCKDLDTQTQSINSKISSVEAKIRDLEREKFNLERKKSRITSTRSNYETTKMDCDRLRIDKKNIHKKMIIKFNENHKSNWQDWQYFEMCAWFEHVLIFSKKLGVGNDNDANDEKIDEEKQHPLLNGNGGNNDDSFVGSTKIDWSIVSQNLKKRELYGNYLLICNDSELKRLGIESIKDRNVLLSAIKMLVNNDDSNKNINGSGINFNNINSGGYCICCTINKITIAFLPCGHSCMCQDCSNKHQSRNSLCPMCKNQIKEAKIVYIS